MKTTINDRIEILLSELQITKTAFAKKLKVSQQYISKLIKTGTPSDILIEDICQKFNVNESWLRNGDGEIFIPESEIVKQAAILLGRKDPDFEALVKMYSKMSDENRRLFVKLGMTLLENKEQKKE